MTDSDTLKLTKALIARPSVTPDDSGCQLLLIERLRKLGFNIEQWHWGQTDNFYATYGDCGPLLCFAGHTDVVPSGSEEHWQSAPFVPTERNGK